MCQNMLHIVKPNKESVVQSEDELCDDDHLKRTMDHDKRRGNVVTQS